MGSINRLNRTSPFLRDVVITTLTSLITILSMIIVTRMLAKGLGVRGVRRLFPDVSK